MESTIYHGNIPYYKNKNFIIKCNEYAKKELELIDIKKKSQYIEYNNIILKNINIDITKSDTFHS